MNIDCAGKTLDLSAPRVMGILNLTTDSFYDGGQFIDPGRALERAHQMVAEGAAIIDVGGESTRPGAEALPVDEEKARVVPLVRRLAAELLVPVSVDTSKPEVMQAAVDAGAGMINDVYALRRPGALDAAVACAVPVCLMHMQGEPRTMQHEPSYADVVGEVRMFLQQRLTACEAAGLRPEQILLDPGFGFGKNLAHNLSLLKHLPQLQMLGRPLLVGMSRKSMLGTIADAPPGQRLPAGVAAHTLAAWLGARVVRVHDVRATVDAMRVVSALRAAE